MFTFTKAEISWRDCEFADAMGSLLQRQPDLISLADFLAAHSDRGVSHISYEVSDLTHHLTK